MFDRIFGRDDPLKRNEVYRTERSFTAFRDELLDAVDGLHQQGYGMLTERGPSCTLHYDDARVTVLHDEYGQRGPENRIRVTVSVDAPAHVDALDEAYDAVTGAVSDIG